MVTVLAGCGSDSPADDPDDNPDSEPDGKPDDALDATIGKPKPDAAVDAAKPDARVEDARVPDAGVVDVGGLDAGAVDAGALDAAGLDARVVDASTDARVEDASSADASTPPAAHTFKFNSKDVWGASGFTVAAGKCYEIETKIDDKWLDLDVPADLSGWIDKSDPRLALFTPFRRVVQDDIGFYQFATCVDKDLDQCFPVAEKSTLCVKSAGELFFFINDASGFESNNVGTATVSIRAK